MIPARLGFPLSMRRRTYARNLGLTASCAPVARAYRGPFASAYMKSVRLDRRADATRWLAVMHRGRGEPRLSPSADLRLRREDNSDVWITTAAEQLLVTDEEGLAPMLAADLLRSEYAQEGQEVRGVRRAGG